MGAIEKLFKQCCLAVASGSEDARKKESRPRAVCGGVSFISYGVFTLAAGVFSLALPGSVGSLAIPMVQNVFYIIFGLAYCVLGLLYCILGGLKQVDCCWRCARVGRRTCLHLVYLFMLNVVVSVFFSFLALAVHSGRTADGTERYYNSYYDYGYRNTYSSIGFWSIFFPFSDQCAFKGVYHIFLVLFSIGCVVGYWVDFCRSDTFRFLRNKKGVKGIYDHVKHVKRQRPDLRFHVECYHYETRTRRVYHSDGNGGGYWTTETYTVKVVTYTGSTRFMYRLMYDASGLFVLDAKYEKKRYIKVNFTKCWIPTDDLTAMEYQRQYEAYKAANRHRDTHMDSWTSMDLPGFKKKVLSSVQETEPCWVKKGIYFLFSCVLLQMLFRYLFDFISGEQDFKYMKRISVTDQISREDYDQNAEIENAIVPGAKETIKNEGGTAAAAAVASASTAPVPVGVGGAQPPMQLQQQQMMMMMMPMVPGGPGVGMAPPGMHLISPAAGQRITMNTGMPGMPGPMVAPQPIGMMMPGQVQLQYAQQQQPQATQVRLPSQQGIVGPEMPEVQYAQQHPTQVQLSSQQGIVGPETPTFSIAAPSVLASGGGEQPMVLEDVKDEMMKLPTLPEVPPEILQQASTSID